MIDELDALDTSYDRCEAPIMASAFTPPFRVLIGTSLSEASSRLQSLGPTSDKVKVMYDAAELTKTIATGGYSLVICDFNMPALSGEQLLRDIRATATHAAHPVVIMGSEQEVSAWIRELPSYLEDQGSSLPGLLSRLATSSEKARMDDRQDDAAAIRARVLEASFQERKRLLKDSLTTAEVTSLLDVSRQTPHDRAKQHRLLAIEDKGQLRFPRWQFDANTPSGVVEGLPDVLQALAVSPIAQARWLTRGSPVFDGCTPLSRLKQGEIDRVVKEARGVGAQAGSRNG